MIKFVYIFKNHGEVEEFLSKCQLLKSAYRYIESALVDSYNDHLCAVFSSKELVMYFVPDNAPSDLFRTYGS